MDRAGRPPDGRCLAIACIALAAGCSGEARIQLRPLEIAGSTCGRPSDARSFFVSALGDFPSDRRSVGADGAVDLADFPEQTRQLAVEILGDGGAVRAIGKTAPFDLALLEDGDELTVAMAPGDGYCPMGPMNEARYRPVVVAAGAGALVLGGWGADGPLGSAEYYDATTGAFTAVEVPSPYRNPPGFAGAAASPLRDGRIVVSGGAANAFVIFDPATRSFSPPGFLELVRAYHAALVLDDGRLLIAGGCGALDRDSGSCAPGSAQRTSFVTDLVSLVPTTGPRLHADRLGGQLFVEASGEDLLGPSRLLLVGGVNEAGGPTISAERIDAASDLLGEEVPGAAGAVAVLDGGAILAALAPRDAPASGAASVVVPGVATARPVAATAAIADATLTALEDGTVLALGGAMAARYSPAALAWQVDTPGGTGPAALDGHGAVRMADGSVLVVGGRDGGGPVASSYLYRPSLDGPFAGSAVATPLVDDPPTPLSPFDPGQLVLDDGMMTSTWQLISESDQLRSWAVVSGPRFVDGTLSAVVRPSGGIAILLGVAGPASLDVVELRAGQPARLVRRKDGAATELCLGQIVTFPTSAVTVSADRDGGRTRATVAGVGVLDCEVSGNPRGLWGVGPLGAGSGLHVDTVSVVRR